MSETEIEADVQTVGNNGTTAAAFVVFPGNNLAKMLM
jgi:hypothetical protein